MIRNFLSTTTVAVALLLAVSMGMGMGSVAAQQSPAENATENATKAGQEAVSPDEDFIRAVDSDTKITDWSYRPGMFTITIEANESKRLSMTEAGDFEEGTGTFNYKEVRLQEGTNSVTMPVTDRQGAGVAIATRESLNQGSGAFVSVGQVARNPFRHFGGETGLLSGVALTVSLAGIGAWYVVYSEEKGVVEA